MDFLTRFGINRGRVTVLVIAALLLLCYMQYQTLPKREDPAVTSRVVVVSAQSPGLSPERIENLIAIPIERKAREIGEISDIDSVSYTHLPSPRDQRGSRMPSSA